LNAKINIAKAVLRLLHHQLRFVMGYPASVIPEKIFFKIGEVCDLVGVQAHVLRYWETEFPMLSPQKNRSGQRTYRRRDVEIAMRVKELLYNEMFTIAGAKKKLQSELREGSSKGKGARTEEIAEETVVVKSEVTDFVADAEAPPVVSTAGSVALDEDKKDALRTLAAQLLELREMVKG
jgi:DNA-binding transcriptional MerR regulator